MSKYNGLHIIYYYILHTIYIILFARHPSRVLRGSFSFPSVQLFVTIRAAAVCGWRPFLENGIFFSLRLSLSFTRPCRLRFNTIIFILSHCFDDRKRARARKPKPARTPAYGTDSRDGRTRATLRSYIIL